MSKQVHWSWAALALLVASAAAQTGTPVTNNNDGQTTPSSAIPRYTGTALLSNSAIVQSSTGNIGIGTSSPAALLGVSNSTQGTSFRIDSNGSDSSGLFSFYGQQTHATTFSATNWVAGWDILVTEKIAAGVTNSGYAYGLYPSVLRNSRTTGDNGTLANLSGVTVQYGHYNADSTATPQTTQAFGVLIEPFYETGTVSNGYDIYLGADQTGGTVAHRYGIYQVNKATNYFAGNVGIGTTNPGAKLEVNGTGIKLTAGSNGVITFQDGTQQATAWTGALCGGDYAESVDVTGDRTNYAPGDVLVIDPEHDGKFLKSAEPYSTSVTGIYSTKPGTVGRRQTGPKSPDEVPMAMIGIVPTKISTENGSIHRGDLLVTSSKIGYAMKGTDRSRLTGAVIGKALGNLDSGTGVIEVVVTLQ